jgi:hypothetical protein
MEFVYAANDGMVSWGPTGSTVHMRPNDIWFADDPFVVARPDLFSVTPLVAHSTQNRVAPPATPVGAAQPVKRAARGR